MIQIDRISNIYADNVIDPYFMFDDTDSWTVTGTGTAVTNDDHVFVGSNSLRIQNTAPTASITASKSTATVINLKNFMFQFSVYLYKDDASFDYTGSFEIYKNAVLLDTQDFELTTDDQWVRFVSDTNYNLSTTDEITFKIILDGIAGHGGTSNLWVDGFMLNVTADRGSVLPPAYSVPRTHVPLEHFGVYDYADATTSGTPINLVADTWAHLTNDASGTDTNTTYALSDVPTIYDDTTSLFDFSDLELGDTVSIRFDGEITTTTPTQTCDIDLVLAYGTPSEYRIPFIRLDFKTAGAHSISRLNDVPMKSTAILNNSARFEARSDDTATFVVNGWYCKANKRKV